MRLWRFLILLLAGASPGSAQFGAQPWPGSDRQVEDEIYQGISAYRESAGLPAVPRSRELDRVAHVHVVDLDTWHPDEGRDARGEPCNTHSWSSHGDWTPVCYTPDHAYAAQMWDKPVQVTHGGYPGVGFEIAYEDFGGAIDAAGAIESGRRSGAHNAVILEQGTWRGAHWQAMGVGVYRGYAVIWFGKEPDPARE